MAHHIVIVDDNGTNARLIKMLLEIDGFQATVCRNIKQAIEAAGIADAFVVDYHLSDNEFGIELLVAIRAGETSAREDTPFILTSGDHRQIDGAINAGANLFMLKPYPPSDLSKALQSILE
jgi:CheY-like chemotaxis protein